MKERGEALKKIVTGVMMVKTTKKMSIVIQQRTFSLTMRVNSVMIHSQTLSLMLTLNRVMMNWKTRPF